MHQSRFVIFESFSQITNEIESQWDDLILKTSANIYMTFTWCRIWWEQYGGGNQLRVFLYFNGDQLIAVLPLSICTLRIGPVAVKVARLIGANNPIRVFDPPICPEHIPSFAGHLIEHLTQVERCDSISFGPYSSEFAARRPFIDAMKERTDIVCRIKESSKGMYTHFHLPQTQEEYLNSLSKNKKHRKKYELKNLVKGYEIKQDTLKDCQQIQEDFPLFVKLHAQQWKQQGKPGHFGAWPGSEQFHKRLAMEFTKQGRTRLLRIRANNETISYEYCYTLGNRCYWLLPARVTGEQWDRLSLGATALVELIRLAIEENVSFIEAGVSRYEYKVKMGAKESSIYGLRLTSKRIESILKDSMLRFCFLVTNLLYFKIWYRRIQPRFKICMHWPIWSGWINLNI